MSDFEVKSFKELNELLQKHHDARIVKIRRAVVKTASHGKDYIQQHMPVAFGDLAESTSDKPTPQGAQIRIGAPHAASVEVGSRPHTPPLGPILDWVKLRGTQGLAGGPHRGTTSERAAKMVRGQLDVLSNARGGVGLVDDPERVARAIQRSIAVSGTKPHFFAQSSLPYIRDTLDTFVQEALAEKPR